MIKTFQIKCPQCGKVLNVIVKLEEYEQLKKDAELNDKQS